MASKKPSLAFNDLPQNLQQFLESSEEFEQIKNLFFIFLKKIKDDVARHKNDPYKAARAFVIIKALKTEFENFEAGIKQVYGAQERSAIPKLFEDFNIPSVPLGEGFEVESVPKYFCAINAMMKDEAYAWLRKKGLGDLIQPSINARTLTSAMRELIKTHGEEPPAPIFKSHTMPIAKITKIKIKTGPVFEEKMPDYSNLLDDEDIFNG